MNLHDWIDELCDALDIETEVDEALVLDLARSAAHNVTKVAAPDHDLPPRRRGRQPGRQPRSDRAAGRARRRRSPTGWDRPADAPDPDDIDDEVPDDSGVDHSDDEFED